VLYRLKAEGFASYLVGGCVRDLLLGREPKDFDVATDAEPEQVKEIFRNCRLIGRRFRLAFVFFGREIIEVATFRAEHGGEVEGGYIENGRIVRDNVFGDQVQDAWRRDFTVNALYYDIRNFSIVDYVGGLNDLRAGVLKLIGDPCTRYREDPVRMLRAVRFAAKLGFRIDKETETPLSEMGYLLRDVSPSRIFDELLKLFLNGCSVSAFELLRHYGMFKHLFPFTEASLAHEENGFPITMLLHVFANTDERVAIGKPVTPAFLFAGLLWEPIRMRMEEKISDGFSPSQALAVAASEVIAMQSRYVSIPKRYNVIMKEIWQLQLRLKNRSGKRALRLWGHPRFRAAYDFLLLRTKSGEEDADLGEWWTRFQEVDGVERLAMVRKLGTQQRRARRRRQKKSVTRAVVPIGEAEEGKA